VVVAKANLTEANLTEADLTEADLTEANLTKADLTKAVAVVPKEEYQQCSLLLCVLRVLGNHEVSR
jgi:uncharacterized protein YjbI with pentapeptide repeats